jgi:hypothetical protein
MLKPPSLRNTRSVWDGGIFLTVLCRARRSEQNSMLCGIIA